MADIDEYSFNLGMINCFAEMVACGVKRLAISPPLDPDQYQAIASASERIVKEYGISCYLDKALLITDLQSASFTEGKWSILYYKDETTLAAYHDLKDARNRLLNAGSYDKEARKQLSHDFMRLLSYPDEVIDSKLSQAEPLDPYIHTETEGES